MTDQSDDITPSEAEQEPTALDADLSINPFAGNQPVEQERSRLALGGNGILSQAGVVIPLPETAEASQLLEGYSTALDASKKACGLIAEMFINNGDPNAIDFPRCNDMNVIGQSLHQLAKTPLGLGYGAFPDTVTDAWARFMKETTVHYRTANELETADLVSLNIDMPAWLEENPSFDILLGCKLMDITIKGSIRSIVASRAQSCRVRFKDHVYEDAVIGNHARHSTFIFDQIMIAKESFIEASNTSVHINGRQAGNIGPMVESRVTCASEFDGLFGYRRDGSTWGKNVQAQQR